MANFGSKILNNAISGLRAQQGVIATSGNNIANVNTPNYTRRKVILQTREGSERGGLQVGSGVEIASIRRQADKYIEGVLRSAISGQFGSQVESEFLARAENLFNLTGSSPTIGSALTNFFAAVNDLTTNPASVELRSNMISKGQDLVNTITDTYNSIANLQDEADNRLTDEVEAINELTAQIATVNIRIAAQEGGGSGVEAADDRDTRETLLNQLAEKISFSRVELADGSVTLTLSNGFPIVNGGVSRELAVTKQPSFATPGSLPQSLSGGTLSYIVFNYGTAGTPAHVDLTQNLMNGSGTIAGLLNVRGYADPTNSTPFEATGTLVSIASRIEGITRGLLTAFNRAYLGPDRDTSTAFWNPSAGNLLGPPASQQVPAVFGFFDFNFSGAKDRLVADGLPTTTDLDDLTANAGVGNFSSRLQLAFTNPLQIAAGYDTSGATSGTLQISPGDARNLQALSAIQSQSMTLAAGGSGTFSISTTLDEGYTELVGHVGGEKQRTDTELSVAKHKFAAAANRRDEISGVSLDEEFTTIILAQKAYTAAARQIKIADDLLQEIIQLI